MLNVAVGGVAYFPDTATNPGGKPWANNSPQVKRRPHHTARECLKLNLHLHPAGGCWFLERPQPVAAHVEYGRERRRVGGHANWLRQGLGAVRPDALSVKEWEQSTDAPSRSVDAIKHSIQALLNWFSFYCLQILSPPRAPFTAFLEAPAARVQSN